MSVSLRERLAALLRLMECTYLQILRKLAAMDIPEIPRNRISRS